MTDILTNDAVNAMERLPEVSLVPPAKRDWYTSILNVVDRLIKSHRAQAEAIMELEAYLSEYQTAMLHAGMAKVSEPIPEYWPDRVEEAEMCADCRDAVNHGSGGQNIGDVCSKCGTHRG